MITLKIKKLTRSAILPAMAYPGDAGFDVFSQENIILKPGMRHVFRLGFKAEIPAGFAALVWDKGGFGQKGIKSLAGVIDSGYRGEWVVILQNISNHNFFVRKGDKIAQILLQKVESAKIKEVKILSKSRRGSGRFGSSGQ